MSFKGNLWTVNSVTSSGTVRRGWSGSQELVDGAGKGALVTPAPPLGTRRLPGVQCFLLFSCLLTPALTGRLGSYIIALG